MYIIYIFSGTTVYSHLISVVTLACLVPIISHSKKNLLVTVIVRFHCNYRFFLNEEQIA